MRPRFFCGESCILFRFTVFVERHGKIRFVERKKIVCLLYFYYLRLICAYNRAIFFSLAIQFILDFYL